MMLLVALLRVRFWLTARSETGKLALYLSPLPTKFRWLGIYGQVIYFRFVLASQIIIYT
jgi:hypothetical protein